jgi:teichuronic acid biosynthesis glycosyltransferase TuaH
MSPAEGAAGAPPSFDVVCCSLEPWDDVWRRNQFLATELLQLRPSLRLLFVGIPVDMAWSIAHRRRPPSAGLRALGTTGRLWTFAPRKWLPRRLRPGADHALGLQVVAAARRLDLRTPVLWINDNSYADLLTTTGWPAVYDVTDDWLLASHAERELVRQRHNDRRMLMGSAEVVVCSPDLATSRGRDRSVHLIPNGVDLDHLRRPQPRPADLVAGPVVLYQGTLNDGRLDIELCAEIATRLAGRATLVFVGPDSLSAASAERLTGAGARLIGARPYRQLPGYLQHADVLVVPHEINPFTESLDPIKAREFVAVGRPTVSTSVAGFRDLGSPVRIAAREEFVDVVLDILDHPMPPGPGPLGEPPTTWTERAPAFLAVLDAAASAGTAPG